MSDVSILSSKFGFPVKFDEKTNIYKYGSKLPNNFDKDINRIRSIWIRTRSYFITIKYFVASRIIINPLRIFSKKSSSKQRKISFFEVVNLYVIHQKLKIYNDKQKKQKNLMADLAQKLRSSDPASVLPRFRRSSSSNSSSSKQPKGASGGQPTFLAKSKGGADLIKQAQERLQRSTKQIGSNPKKKDDQRRPSNTSASVSQKELFKRKLSGVKVAK